MTEFIAPIDRHVERAFDMLQHVYGFLHSHHPLKAEELERVMAQLFPVVEHWLTLAAPARIPLLMDVLDALPDHKKVADRLAGVRVHEERTKALQALAEQEVADSVAKIGAVATFRECANNWRGVLPHPYQLDGAHPIICQGDGAALRAASLYWTGPLTDRHTRLGPSYRLSKAAGFLARAVASSGMDSSRARPCSELRQAIEAMPDWCGELDPTKRTERLERSSAVLCDALLLADELELRAAPAPLKVQTTPSDSTAGMPECRIEYLPRNTIRITEGPTSVTISGPRRVWLFNLVTGRAGQTVSWKDALTADMTECGENLDRRMRSKSARSKSGDGYGQRRLATPKSATSAKTLQNLGSRISRDLMKLSYHWEQDGQGARWSAACT